MRFLFDNNLSQYLAKAIHALCEPHGVGVEHLREKFPHNVQDREWIAALGAEGGWSIVSQDRFTKSSLEKEALRRSGLVAFIMAKGWANHKEWEKAWRLVRWWPRIMEQANLVEGGAVFEVPVRFVGKGKFRPIKL